MRAWLEHEEPRGTSSGDRRHWMLAASGAFLAIGLVAHVVGATRLAQVASLLTIVSGGVPSVRRAWSALRLRTFDMHVLMTVAVVGAVAIGEWLEGATVVFLFGLAQFLESRSMARARHAIRALMDLSPAEATVVREGVERGCRPTTCALAITCASGPERSCRSTDGSCPAKATSTRRPSRASRCPWTSDRATTCSPGRSTGTARWSSSRRRCGATPRWRASSTWSRPRKPSVRRRRPSSIGSRASTRRPSWRSPPLVAIVPPLAGGGEWSVWLYRALVLLVIACPCALVIATPVAIVSALAAGARRGVLIKGGAHLERLASRAQRGV